MRRTGEDRQRVERAGPTSGFKFGEFGGGEGQNSPVSDTPVRLQGWNLRGAGVRESERERERERERQRQIDRQTDRDRDTERERERD